MSSPRLPLDRARCQVRKKDTGHIYAMKVLQKDNIIKRNQVEHTRTERNVLGRILHPFIVGLNYAFQTPDKVRAGMACTLRVRQACAHDGEGGADAA